MPFKKGHKGYWTGKKFSEETKRKLGIPHTGLLVGDKNPMFGKPAWNRGKHWPQEIRKKLSLARIGKIPWNKGKRLPQFSGINSPAWKGGKIIKEGYVLIYQPNHPFVIKPGCRYIYQHRLVVERQIGRYLLPTETVHHLGEKDDNHPKMLMAFINKSAHQRFEYNPNNVNPKEIIFDGRPYQCRRIKAGVG